MKKVRPALKYILFFGIGVLLLWLAFRNQDQEEILEAFKGANYWWLALSVFLMLLSDVSRAVRWRLLIRPLGYKVSNTHSFIAVMIGYLSNMVLPRMGELTRCVTLRQTDEIPVDSLVGTVIVERVLDLFMLLVFIGLTLILESNDLIYFYSYILKPKLQLNLIPYLDIELLILILLLAGGGALTYYFFHRKYGRSVIERKLKELYRGFKSGLKTIRSLESPWKFWLHTVFIWVMYWGMTYVVFFSFDSTSQLSPIAGLAVFVIGSVGFIMPVQGGIGTYHWAVTEGLSIYGIQSSVGLTYATLLHATQFLAILIVGGISYIAFAYLRYHRVRSEIEEESDAPEKAVEEV